MNKKYIFLDLDGTILDHNNGGASTSTLEAIKLLHENGHEVFIATGRPPCLFYGIDKELNIPSYIAANGRIAVLNGKVIFKDPIDPKLVHDFTAKMEELGFDVGYESFDDYFVQSKKTELPDKFSEAFRLDYPEIKKDKYQNEDIYQMILYTKKDGLRKAHSHFPHVHYSYSNPYGIDVTDHDGLKDVGIKAVVEYLGIRLEDCIAVGDGFNDISMLQYVGLGIAMGNAHDEVKEYADMVTDSIDNDGLFKAFKKIGLI